jgi:hypothetical protein
VLRSSVYCEAHGWEGIVRRDTEVIAKHGMRSGDEEGRTPASWSQPDRIRGQALRP